MSHIKKLLGYALGLTVVSALGCEVTDECDEAGICDDLGSDDTGDGVDGVGGAGGADEVALVYDTLIIFDDGSPDDGQGTSGVDLCGVRADCAAAVRATLTLGGGEVCRAEGPGCGADRSDATAILDDGMACDASSAPSDYVSLGIDGSIAVEFDGDLAGCTVTVVEFAGATEEGYSVYVCDAFDLEGANCLNDGDPVHEAAAGGEVTFNLPPE